MLAKIEKSCEMPQGILTLFDGKLKELDKELDGKSKGSDGLFSFIYRSLSRRP
jgi:hypothetical protein